jgi:hypothetical protein
MITWFSIITLLLSIVLGLQIIVRIYEEVKGRPQYIIADGYYCSAKQASAFYGAAANEIATACKEGKIRCSDNPTGNLLAPAITLSDGARLLKSFWRMSVHALTFKDIAGKHILVSYIDAMSFPAQLRYLFVIYSALITLTITALPMPLWLKS